MEKLLKRITDLGMMELMAFFYDLTLDKEADSMDFWHDEDTKVVSVAIVKDGKEIVNEPIFIK